MSDKWMWLNYHHLLYFTMVVEEGGLVPAAERLGVSHPTVSEQVKKLERQLGLKLFDRRGRKLHLTEDGRFVHEQARQLFGVGAELIEAVEARRSGRSILCRVGVDSVLAKLLVRQLLAPMLDIGGDALHLRCMEDGREELIPLLASRHLDIVLSDGPAQMQSSDLRARILARSELAFFATPELAERLPGEFPAQLDGAPMLLPLGLTRLRRELERWFGEVGVQPRVVGEIEDSGLLKALGQDGRGVFAMPSAVSAEVERQYQVIRLGTAEGVEARVFALCNEAGERNPAVKALLAAHESD